MTILLLDERWPTQIPLEAVGAVEGPVEFSSEVPVSVRWNIDKLLRTTDGEGLWVSMDPHDPETRRRMEQGERVIEAASLSDAVWQAQQVMQRARRIGQWEREQTHETLLPYLEEEAAEFAEAVREAPAEMCKELGDVFLQVLFHAEIASTFSLDDVAASFVTKMRSRAPYLFDGTEDIVDVDEQERLWAEGKRYEDSVGA